MVCTGKPIGGIESSSVQLDGSGSLGIQEVPMGTVVSNADRVLWALKDDSGICSGVQSAEHVAEILWGLEGIRPHVQWSCQPDWSHTHLQAIPIC